MSRQIDLTKPLSSDERSYLEDRGLQAALDENALHLMGGGSDEEAPNEPYSGWVKADLKAEIERRNAELEDDAKIAPESDKNDDLVAALIASDAAAAESGEDDGEKPAE